MTMTATIGTITDDDDMHFYSLARSLTGALSFSLAGGSDGYDTRSISISRSYSLSPSCSHSLGYRVLRLLGSQAAAALHKYQLRPRKQAVGLPRGRARRPVRPNQKKKGRRKPCREGLRFTPAYSPRRQLCACTCLSCAKPATQRIQEPVWGGQSFR